MVWWGLGEVAVQSWGVYREVVGRREWEGAEVLTPSLSCCRHWCCFWPGASHCGEVKRAQHGNLNSSPIAGDPLPPGGYSGTPIPCLTGLSTQLEQRELLLSGTDIVL